MFNFINYNNFGVDREDKLVYYNYNPYRIELYFLKCAEWKITYKAFRYLTDKGTKTMPDLKAP
ncbi:hypothetical protein LX87_00668 [Larkinella arboricola]|uniref:Uncharacterized protein n=1 Tax=Larkinella arboricola TaxID=643671 RepID=A0A327X8J8_LARAB|nr:hypothetical protein LX87_00668 [Larkinella arboricola]